jgi:general secretion pathway protein D
MPRRLVLVILAVIVVPLAAQSPRAAEADARFALREAQRLALTDPPKALDRLQRLLSSLQTDHTLPADRRDALTRIVKDRIRVVQAAPEATPTLPPPPLSAEAAKRAEEFARVKVGLTEAVELRKQGKTTESNARVAELSRQFPDNVAVQVMNTIGETTAKREDAEAIRKDKEQGAVAALNNVDRAAVSPKNDVEFAKDHKEKMAKRKADTAPTADELRMLKALDMAVTAQFMNSRLEDVTDYLSTLIGLPIMIDKAALDELNLTYDSPVTFVMKKPVAARTALRGVLRSLGLTYAVRDGIVHATTPARTRDFMVMKTYYLGDLVAPIGNPFAPVGDPLQQALNVQMLLDMIVSTVDPDSWDVRGGPGTIRYVAAKQAIVVRQSAEVHASLKASLYK